MDPNEALKLEKLKARTVCHSEFACCKRKLNGMAYTKDFGNEVYLICENHTPFFCEHARSFGFGFFCSCPVNIFLTKNQINLNKVGSTKE